MAIDPEMVRDQLHAAMSLDDIVLPAEMTDAAHTALQFYIDNGEDDTWARLRAATSAIEDFVTHYKGGVRSVRETLGSHEFTCRSLASLGALTILELGQPPDQAAYYFECSGGRPNLWHGQINVFDPSDQSKVYRFGVNAGQPDMGVFEIAGVDPVRHPAVQIANAEDDTELPVSYYVVHPGDLVRQSEAAPFGNDCPVVEWPKEAPSRYIITTLQDGVAATEGLAIGVEMVRSLKDQPELLPGAELIFIEEMPNFMLPEWKPAFDAAATVLDWNS